MLHDTYDVCAAHGFAFTSIVESWRGAPGSAPPSASNVVTRSEVQNVDNLGRILRVKYWNDVHVLDDDTCVYTTYAEPVGANERVLFAPRQRTVSDCGDVINAAETWSTTAPAGSVASGSRPRTPPIAGRIPVSCSGRCASSMRSTTRWATRPHDHGSRRRRDSHRHGRYDDFSLVPTVLTAGRDRGAGDADRHHA